MDKITLLERRIKELEKENHFLRNKSTLYQHSLKTNKVTFDSAVADMKLAINVMSENGILHKFYAQKPI
jgi:hypothetical protein